MSYEELRNTQQIQRRDAFRALIARHHQDPEDYDDDDEAPENPRPYLNGTKEIGRFVCVTDHNEKTFFLPEFADRYAAQSRAVEYVHDDIWAEYPIEVFDLDTGTVYRPAFSTIQWTMTTPAPAPEAS